MKPFRIKSERDYIAAERYRIACMEARDPGIIIEEGVEYPVDENGKMNKWPSTMNIQLDLITYILSTQAKRRKERMAVGL
jgi:hypothetical protein